MDLRDYVEQVFDQLHAIPETAFNEYKTAALLAAELQKFGFAVQTGVGGTGIVASLDSGKPGPVLALRGDMDALEFEFGGRKQVIHACGHDAHSAMVMAAAASFGETGLACGKLVVVFQPAEEQLNGAKAIIDSGLLAGVEEMVGIHLRPLEEAKLGEATPALLHGASYIMRVRIRGQSAHGARPHLGINAVDAAVLAINAVNAVRVSPRVSHSVKTTYLRAGGDAHNIIPAEAVVAFDLRAQTNAVMEELLTKTREAIESSAKALGATAVVEHCEGVPAAEYNDELVADAAQSIEAVLGQALLPIVSPGGEDFHFYATDLKIKTAYIGLGADLTPGLHNPEMCFDRRALGYGAGILRDIVARRLGGSGS